MYLNDTIYALSTPQGNSAIALIRLSGNQSITILSHFFSTPKFPDTSLIPSRLAVFGKILSNDSLLDEVILTIFRSPNSFTGEDVVEIASHGSLFITASIMQMLSEYGARIAQPGEFTKRAWLNGKMDLSQAEAVADLIHAESQAAHRIAINQLKGGFTRELQKLRQSLVDFASLIELELDFSEENVEFANRNHLSLLVTEIRSAIHKLAKSFKVGNAIKNGVPVAIVGAPNAGKSTLLNTLLNEEKAIVSPIPGTTRDVIEDFLDIQGVRFRLIDTAGIRNDPDNEIEKIGIDRSFQKIREATLVLYVCDSSINGTDIPTEWLEKIKNMNPEADILFIAGKSDMEQRTLIVPEDVVVSRISALKYEGIEELKNTMLALSGGLPDTGQTIVSSQRHYEALMNADKALERVLEQLAEGVPGDLLAMDIRQALRYLGEITGEISTDDLLGNIFSRFCIGK
jgi:tRNA modification GTPase